MRRTRWHPDMTTIADAIAAGVRIDWGELRVGYPELRDRQLLRQLKIVAAVAEFYRRRRSTMSPSAAMRTVTPRTRFRLLH